MKSPFCRKGARWPERRSPPWEPISRFKVSRAKTAKCGFRLPAKERLSELVAWHPTLGATGKRDLENRPREGTTELSLLPPAPHTIHVVDVDGHGIGGVELGVSVHPEDSRLDRRQTFQRGPCAHGCRWNSDCALGASREAAIRRSRHSWFRLEAR